MRICTKCKLELSEENFYNYPKIRCCKECHTKVQAEYRNKNRMNINKKRRERHRPRDKEKAYLDLIKYCYDLNKENYLYLKEKQNNKCFICGKDPTPCKNSPGRLNVDHDHTTGFIRALICRHCNTIIGHCFEDISILNKVINYLNLFKNKNTEFKIPEEKLNKLNNK